MTSHRDIKNELLDELLTDYGDPKDILGKEGLLHQLQKKIVERVLDAELEHHLGYAVNERSDSSNARNGKTRKTIKTDTAQPHWITPLWRIGSGR